MTIYDKVLDAIENGGKYHIDLINHTLKLNKETLIDHGKAIGEYDIEAVFFHEHGTTQSSITAIEELYAEYKHSRPGKRDTGRTWFKAIKADELEHEDYDFGAERYIAQFKLEYTVLAAILLGVLNESIFERPTDWFWSSKNDRDLIISRKWLIKNN